MELKVDGWHHLQALGSALPISIVQRQNVEVLCLIPPKLQQLLQLVRLYCRQIIDLGEVIIELIELPDVTLKVIALGVMRHGLPSTTPNRAIAEKLKNL